VPLPEGDDDDIDSLFGHFQSQIDQIEEEYVIAGPNNQMVILSDDEEEGQGLSKEDEELLSLKDF
jgi:hypothetical protein